MRIALLIGSLGLGGAERQCVELAKALHKGGEEVWVVYFNANHVQLLSELESNGVSTVSFPAKFRGDLRPIIPLAKWFRRERVELMHSFLFTEGYLGRVAALLARVRIVVQGERNACEQQTRAKIVTDRILSKATDHFIANSFAGAETLYAAIRVPREKVSVIPNGIDLTRFACKDGRSGNAVVISIGRLWPQKNYETALRVIAKCATTKSMKYWIVGDADKNNRLMAEYANSLRDLSGKLGLDGVVEWLGYRTDIPELLSRADIFLSTSHYEGMQNSLLEAMATGLPVVASNVSDNESIVREGKEGYLISRPDDAEGYAEKVSLLMQEPILREQMGCAAQMRIQQGYSVDVMASKHVHLYRTLLGNSVCEV